MRTKFAVLFALAAVLSTGVLFSANQYVHLKRFGTSVNVADGTDPPPTECGLWDICRVQKS